MSDYKRGLSFNDNDALSGHGHIYSSQLNFITCSLYHYIKMREMEVNTKRGWTMDGWIDGWKEGRKEGEEWLIQEVAGVIKEGR